MMLHYAEIVSRSYKLFHWKKEMHFAVCFSGHYLRSSGRLPFSCCTWKHQAANQSLWASAENWPWKTFQKEQINLFCLRLLRAGCSALRHCSWSVMLSDRPLRPFCRTAMDHGAQKRQLLFTHFPVTSNCISH